MPSSPPQDASSFPLHALWHRAHAWLNRVPLADPVEKRNAPFLQLILMFLGTFLPLALVRALAQGELLPIATLEALFDLVTDLILTTACWIGIGLIRKGRLRHGLILFLGILLGSLALMGLLQNIRSVIIDPTFPVLSLLLSGLIMGRGALWKIFACLLGILALAWLGHFLRTSTPAPSGPLLHFVALYLCITAVLDRTISALRDSMEISDRQSRLLSEANARLREEMAERERAQERLVHAQKMEAVGRVASGVAHDFNNLLNVVLGIAARRERIAAQGTPALLDALGNVDLAARRALAVSRKLLNFSRQDSSHPTTFDAATALRELGPMLRQLFDAETQVRLDLGEAAQPIHMDHGQFELMVLNIAANARDAMPQGGTFSILARRAGDAPALELELRDTGSGMPEAVRARIFDPFYTTKPSGKGTGLGMTVVYDLVRSAQGTIEVASAPGEGTSFRIRLPLASQAAAEESKPALPAPA